MNFLQARKALQAKIMQVSGGMVLFHRIYGVPVLKKVLNTVMSVVSDVKASCEKFQYKKHPNFLDQIYILKTFTRGKNWY